MQRCCAWLLESCGGLPGGKRSRLDLQGLCLPTLRKPPFFPLMKSLHPLSFMLYKPKYVFFHKRSHNISNYLWKHRVLWAVRWGSCVFVSKLILACQFRLRCSYKSMSLLIIIRSQGSHRILPTDPTEQEARFHHHDNKIIIPLLDFL